MSKVKRNRLTQRDVHGGNDESDTDEDPPFSKNEDVGNSSKKKEDQIGTESSFNNSEFGKDFNEIKKTLSDIGMERLLQVISSGWKSDRNSAIKQALISAADSLERAKTDMLSKNWGEHDSYGKYSLNFKNGQISFPHPVNYDEETVTFDTSDGEWTHKGTFDFELGYRVECRECECDDAVKARYSVKMVDYDDGIAKEIYIKGEGDCGTAYCRKNKPSYICSLNVKAK